MYKVNLLSVEQMFANLSSLLNASNEQAEIPSLFLNQEEMLEILKTETSSTCSKKFEFQQPVAVVWDEASGKQWYIGFVISESSDSLVIDHLERKTNDTNWQRPSPDDTQTVSMTQIIPCSVEGEWEFSARSPQFIVKNSENIKKKLKEHWG